MHRLLGPDNGVDVGVDERLSRVFWLFRHRHPLKRLVPDYNVVVASTRINSGHGQKNRFAGFLRVLGSDSRSGRPPEAAQQG
jgi:hypothetical protein